MFRSGLQIWWWVSLCCIVGGCGYTLSHRLKGPLTSPRGIFVRVFDNETDEVGAEAPFTNALIRELQSRRQVKLKGPAEGALELRGVLQAVGQSVTSATDPGYDGLASFRRLPTEIGITTRIALTLVDPDTSEVMWSQSFNVFHRMAAPIDRTKERLAPSATGLTTQSMLEARFTDIARDIMREVYDEMVELF